SRGTAQQAPLTAYGLSMALLYGSSGAYHAVPATHPDWVEALRLLDLCSIHLLIAGSCTALFAALPPGPVRARLTALAWLLAAAGIVARLVLREIPYPLAVAGYAGQGLVGMLPFLAVGRRVGAGGLVLVIGGGLVYLTGATCEVLQRPAPWP